MNYGQQPRYCKLAGPLGLYCDRRDNHIGWHSRMRAGKYYEWMLDRPTGRVIDALCNGEPIDLAAGALPRTCHNHDMYQICPDCTS